MFDKTHVLTSSNPLSLRGIALVELKMRRFKENLF